MKKICSAMIVSALVVVTAGQALADTRIYVGPAGGPPRFERGHRPPPPPVVRHHNDDALAAGVMGLLGGIVVGSMLDNDSRVPVVRHYRDYRYDPPRAQRHSGRVGPPQRQLLEPWSPSWYRWCQARYRSFDPRSGTFRDFDGHTRFCEARG